jgi:hypothetical protein
MEISPFAAAKRHVGDVRGLRDPVDFRIEHADERQQVAHASPHTAIRITADQRQPNIASAPGTALSNSRSGMPLNVVTFLKFSS